MSATNTTHSARLSLPPRPLRPPHSRRRLPSQTLSFRVPGDMAERVERAATAEGLSVSDYLRALLETHFEQPYAAVDELRGLKTSLAHLNESVAVAVEGLMVSCTNGRKIPVEEAVGWVNENIRRTPL